MPFPTVEHAVRFPINAVLEANLCDGDDVKMLLLIKKDKNNFYEENKGSFLEELQEVIGSRNINVITEIIYTDFSEKREVHEKLLEDLLEIRQLTAIGIIELHWNNLKIFEEFCFKRKDLSD